MGGCGCDEPEIGGCDDEPGMGIIGISLGVDLGVKNVVTDASGMDEIEEDPTSCDCNSCKASSEA